MDFLEGVGSERDSPLTANPTPLSFILCSGIMLFPKDLRELGPIHSEAPFLQPDLRSKLKH